MKRRHFIEISDERWCPQTIKDAVTDYCRFVLAVAKPYQSIAPTLARALRKTGARRVLDLCSGASGPWIWLQPLLSTMGAEVAVCLTDQYPNTMAFERARRLGHGAISFQPKPVDATHVPAELTGFRTIFMAFHHFRPDQARAILSDATRKGEGIAVVECGKRNIVLMLLAMLDTPGRVLLATPFIRPFRWSRLFWTYLVPVVPVVMMFDTVVSCLRVYTVEELHELTAGLDGYHWDIGVIWSKMPPIPNTYLIGVPVESEDPAASSPLPANPSKVSET